MTDHACPFCGAKLDVAKVPPGDWLRCGSCFFKLERGETALSPEEVQAYRRRRKLRRFAIVILACLLPWLVGVVIFRVTRNPRTLEPSLEGLVAMGVACVVSLIWPIMDWLRTRAPVPVAPVAGKVEA